MNKRQNRKARKTNVEAFGTTSEVAIHDKEWAHYNKMLPKSKTDFRKITAHLASIHKKDDDPTSVSPIALAVANRLWEIGMRENTEKLDKVVCPTCDEAHEIVCPKCENPHVINILDSTKEKTSVTCLSFLGERWFAKKAPQSQTINLEKHLEKISEYVVDVLNLIPAELQKNKIEKWLELVAELSDESD